MSLKSLNHILGVIEKQAKWQEQPFQQVCQLWAEVVGSASSAAWAQNLTFSRQTLLHKLNQKLSTPLVDLRFSTAGWQRQPAVEKPQAKVLPSQHPSYLGKVNERREVRDVSRDANEVFNNWAKKRQMRSHSLPLCPQCECPTPPGELQLWGVCGFCSVKQLTKS
jgi:predicted nucleic acid-binding Zn ribbon protein